jgi:hypothetical protein
LTPLLLRDALRLAEDGKVKLLGGVTLRALREAHEAAA